MRSHLVLVNLDSVDRREARRWRGSAAGHWFAGVVYASVLGACGASDTPLFREVEEPTEEAPSLEPAPLPVEEPPAVDDPAPVAPDDSGEEPGKVPLDDGGENGDGAADDGKEPPGDDKGEGDPEPPPPEGPSVISVFPADGASAVSSDTEIVIRFSSPMNEEATERAYQSERIPSSGVTFSWSEDGTELTITPNQPLEYDTGTDPAQVEARRYSFFLSGSAEDVDGNQLEAPEEFSFSVLRQIQARLTAVQDPDLTGNWRSDNQYGDGDCGRNAANICVGDQRTGTNNRQYKGFVTFDLSDLPLDMVAVSGARLNLQITGMAGNPFGGLGDLFVEHASFDAIGAQAFNAAVAGMRGAIAGEGGAGTVVSMDVLPAVEQDVSERLETQYRFVFGRNTDNDRNNDAIFAAWEMQTLDVFYLLP